MPSKPSYHSALTKVNAFLLLACVVVWGMVAYKKFFKGKGKSEETSIAAFVEGNPLMVGAVVLLLIVTIYFMYAH